MNKLPLNWCECKLEDVCSLENGIKSTDLNLPLLDAKYLRGKKEAEYRNNGVVLNSGDYVILVDGENSGEVFSIPQKGIMGSTFKLLNFASFCEKKYVLYFIHSYQDLFRTNKKGAAIPHLNKEIFKNLELPVPPLAEQGRIVEKIEYIFAKIDEGVEKLKSAQEKIKQYKQSVLHSAFTGKLYKTTEWKVDLFENVFEPISVKYEIKQKNYKSNGLYPIVDQGEDFIGGYSDESIGIIDNIPLIAFGDHTRRFKYIDFSFIVGGDGLKLYKSKYTDMKFSYYMCLALDFPNKGYARHNALLKKCNFPLPTLSEQERIVEEIEKRFTKADKMLDAVEKSLQLSEQLKQSVLKKAFEGRLVPQDPNDEPASVLLERIKSEKQQNEKVKGKKK